MRKRIILIVLGLLVAIPLTVVSVLVYTQTGVEMIAARLNQLERLGIKIEGISGTLAGPLRIQRFELDNPNVHIVTHDVVAYFEYREILWQTVRVSSLTARDTLVELRTAPPKPPKPPRFLPSFMRISARGLDFDKLRFVNVNGTAVDADRLRAAGRINSKRLRVAEFQIDAPRFNLSGKGELQAQQPMALQVTAQGNLRMERGTTLAGTAQLSGTVEKLGIKAQIQQPNVASADVTLTRPEKRWRIAGVVNSQEFSLQPWMEKPPFSLNQVALRVDANPDRILVSGRIGVPEYDDRPFTLDAQGKFASRVLQLDKADIALGESAGRIHASGTVTFGGAAPALDVAARWTDLQWPLRGKAVASSSKGDLTMKGPQPYDYTLNAHVAVPRAAEGDASARGVLSKEDVTIDGYELQTLGGSITGTGSLQFKEPRAWTLSARGVDINPVDLHREFPGRLVFTADAHGRGLNKNATFNVKLASLRGRLRQQALNGSGSLERSASTWRAQNIQVSMGEARLALNGTMGNTVDAQWSLQAESLESLLPQARGKIDFKGSAKGPARSPHVIADLQGQSLRYQSWRIETVTLSSDVDLAGNDPSRISLQAQNIARAAPLIQSLRIDGDGNAAEHKLSLVVAGADRPDRPAGGRTAPRADLKIVGHYIKEIWTATVTATNIETGTTKEQVSIAAPANILFSRDRASMDDLCLALGNGRFCANGKWQRNGPWEGTVSGYELPLAALLPPSTDQGEYAGRIEGRIHAFGTPGRPWQGELGLRIIDAAIIYRPQGAEPETLNLGNGGVAATATAERVEWSLGLQAFQDTFLYANGRIVRNGSNDLLNLPLTADVRMRAADANILPIVFPEIDHAAGVLSANADIRGTLATPEVQGRLELARGEFDSYRINLALRELNLVANIAANTLDFKGSARAGEGQLAVNGDFAWREGISRGELTLNGQNLLVADLPEYHVVASPDLKFQIDGRNLKAAGDLTIPTARIQPVNLSGAVQASDDARYVGEHSAEREGRFLVESQIRVKMGNDVQVDAFGLQGRIGGGVETIVRTTEQPIGRGELSVVDGRYEAYGQKLEISRGRLLFDNSPLDDPGLDIEARRKVETVEVGLNVRGTLRGPRLTFFSDPSMPQSQVVSYLLVGKPIDSMQSGGASSIDTSALAAQGGGVLAGQLGRRLGLDEVGVESSLGTGGEANRALVLGKFLSPRLFISYGISLTESINTLKLRYTISDKWILKTEAGEAQSLDVEYTIQK
jgi:translocation and assembly module TamB